MSVQHEAELIGYQVRRIAQRSAPWVEGLARAGYLAKGVVYCVIGGLTLFAALGYAGGQVSDQKGAMREIYAQPLGQFLVGLVAFGFAGFALWRAVQAVLDPEDETQADLKGIVKRIGRGLGAFAHAALVVFAIGLLTGAAFKHGDEAKSISARLMAWDQAGTWVVGVVGAIVVSVGLHQIYIALAKKLDEHLDLSSLRQKTQRIVVGFSRFGVAARGVVFSVIGSFAIVAAVRADPSEAKGFAAALHYVSTWSYGWLALAFVSVGLIAYGLYELVEARFRHIRSG